MISFVPTFPTEHQGVARVESAVATVRQLRQGFDSTKGLSAMLLAAIVSALVVVADQMVDTWAEGHLLAAWVVLWAVGFAAVALFAGTARDTAKRLVLAGDAWSARLAQSRADQRFLLSAQSDPRIMADLNAAILRQRGE